MKKNDNTQKKNEASDTNRNKNGGNDDAKRTSVLRILTPPSKQELAAQQSSRITKILWRDFVFFVLALLGSRLMSFVELNASNPELRGFSLGMGHKSYHEYLSSMIHDSCVIDTGYILTTPIYLFLKANRHWNDILAGLNSIVLLVPAIYTSYVTFLKGDFELAFRYLATHLLRSFCGWFTYLPPDPDYLPSNYDFPDIWQCLVGVQDCSQQPTPEALPFVSFFSGHVSTMVCTANHMYVHGHKKMGILCHVLNALQIIRFLATRGHYSIDIIIAWYVAKYVSNPAGRLGRYFSKGTSMEDLMPESAKEAFELVTGVSDVMEERVVSELVKKQDLQKVLREMMQDDTVADKIMVESNSETTATLMMEELEKAASASPEKERQDDHNKKDQ